MSHHIHHTKRISLLLAMLMIFSLLFPTAGSAAYTDEIGKLEQEKENIQKDKIEAGNNAASLREQKASWVERKAALDEQNRLTQEEILNTQQQIEVYNNAIAEKKAEAEAAQAAAEDAFAVYKKHLRTMEENGKLQTYMGVLIGAEDFTEILTRVDTLTEIMEYDKRIEQGYKDARDAAITAKEEYEQLHGELEEKKHRLEEDVTRLEQELAVAAENIEALQKEIEKFEAIYNAALQREYAVQNSINAIIAELKAAEEAAKNPQPTPPSADDNTDTVPETPAVKPPDTSTVTGSYIWPLPSSKLVTSPFGNRVHPEYGTVKFHKGIDINAAMGASIVAADGGSVVTVGNDPAGYGIYVVIYHSGGRSTLYAHMNAAAVSPGQTVTQGQVIGYAGSSGVSTGPHLHFEIAVDGALHDPLGYFSGYSIWNG